MNKFLLSTFIGGAAIVILSNLGYSFDNRIIALFILLVPILFGVKFNILLYENPEREIKASANNLFYRNYTEEAKKAAAKNFYNNAKKAYPVLILIFSAQHVGMCVYRIINRQENHYFTLVSGILLAMGMIALTGVYIHQKKRFYAKENIRTYASIFFNFLMSLMLISR